MFQGDQRWKKLPANLALCHVKCLLTSTKKLFLLEGLVRNVSSTFKHGQTITFDTFAQSENLKIDIFGVTRDIKLKFSGCS